MRMALLLPIVLAAACATVQAANDPRAERQRIHAEIAAAEADHAAAARDCRARFAVNDCLADARRVRAERLQHLRTQQALLDETERRSRAAERRAALDAKQAQAASRATAASTPLRRMRVITRVPRSPAAAASR